MTVKVRIAPSPTGNLHIGTARTALFNWLFARHHGGEFFLRIEDTDVERSQPEYEKNIIEGLRWLGLSWDNTTLYRQSERLPIYRQHLERLLNESKAFWCHHTVGELEEEKKRQELTKEPVRHVCEHKDTPLAKEPGQIIRLSTHTDSARALRFDDAIRGSIEVKEHFIGDISLAKNLDTPLYNFAVVVDDLEMAITHVIRGEDHISNTPKQLLIYEALGKTTPIFAHLPLILGPDRSKMSKRHGATSIAEYAQDYLPDALVNFLAHLGHTYEKDILTRDEMISGFDLSRVHKSGAVFDVQKLNWINAQHMKTLSPEVFTALVGHPELPEAAIPVMTERLERLTDVAQFSYFWEEPTYEPSLLLWKETTPQEALRALEMIAEIAKDGDLTQDKLDTLAKEHFNGQKGSVYWPLRTALSGARNSPAPLDIASIIGGARTHQRIARGIEALSTL
jgi:glutamyl-tRNA synthetase